jgi:hypothetical protein
MLRRRKPTKDDFPRPWEDRPISPERWQRHRRQLLEWETPGKRPEEWWLYECGRERPDNEAAILYGMGELRDSELATVMKWWKSDFDKAEGHTVAERRRWFKWAGIPPELVEQWDAEHQRRKPTMTGA